MLKPRSGLVLSFSSLFLALVASNCTVNSTDGDDDDDDGNGCIEGRTTSCNCDDGSEGSQECTSRGTWGECECEDGTGGTSGSGGSGGKGGSSGSGGTGGTDTGYAGEGGYGGWTPTTGGTHAGGEGGAPIGGGGMPGLCEEPEDACQGCYFGQCCSQLEACLNDEVCVDQFVAMRECSNIVVAQHDATPADIDACAPAPNGSNHWPGNHTPNMIALIDCMNGGVGWESASAWPHGTCLDCYKHDGPVTGGEGGAGGQAGGGEAGAGPVAGACEDPEGSCQECYFGQCCAQFEACLDNPTCVDQFVAMRSCSNEVVSAHGHATPSEIDACAPAPNGSNHWPGNHEPETIALIDCMNGGVGWENATSWPHGTCLSCYQSE